VLLLADWDRVAEIHGTTALTHVVAIPRRNLDDYIACHYRLAAEARMEGQAWRHVEAIQFVVVRRAQVLIAVFYDHVAGSASAASAAGMFELNAEVDGDVKQRLRLPVFVVGQFSRLELHGPVDIRKSHLGHNSIVACEVS
jgi:hypothetical protein